nr:putative f-box protein [Quercus suber]
MEVIFSNEDLAMEILIRLSPKNLLRYKCVSKRWTSLISDPSFVRIHHQRSRCISGLLVQEFKEYGGNFRGDDYFLYASVNGKWKTSLEVCTCHCKDELLKNKHIFVNGRFYWLTRNQTIITFEVDEELSGVITVPGSKCLEGGARLACLGDSDGYLHYVCVDMPELRVWMLTDPCKPIWVLKHHINIDQFGEESRDHYNHHVRHSPEMTGDSFVVDAQTFHDEVVYLSIRGRLCSYDFKTGRLRFFFNGLYLRHMTKVQATVLPIYTNLGNNWHSLVETEFW